MVRGTNSTRGPAQRSTLMPEPLGGTTPLALAQRGLGYDLALALASWFRLPHCFGGVLYYTERELTETVPLLTAWSQPNLTYLDRT